MTSSRASTAADVGVWAALTRIPKCFFCTFEKYILMAHQRVQAHYALANLVAALQARRGRIAADRR
jgi:hypothetical protein